MIKTVLVLGGGSAGLIAAISLKRKIPHLQITIVRSPEIGVIGVGEATTPNFPRHLFEYLGISRRHFYATADPTWKMGIHFIWGPRGTFEYAFQPQMDVQWRDLPRPNGYFCDEDFSNVNPNGALMALKKAFPRQKDGGPEIPPWHAFHIENPKLVHCLEMVARDIQVNFIDAKVQGAEKGPQGIAAVILEDGRRLEADFFVDASGFRSELLGKTLEEPFVPFSESLFNDRAVVGSWDRTDEFILPYTTAETMDAGWCWQIDHEHTINRGYVYCSRITSDEDAAREFHAKNPKVKTWDRVVKFRSGRYQRGWVGNTMAIGNASGFVEPLESTALMVVCWQSQTFCDMLNQNGSTPTPTMQALFNRVWSATWDEIRDFLTIHFKFNGKLNTPYWEQVRNETNISRLQELLEFYDQNGPTGFARYFLPPSGSQFGIEGFLIMLVGNRVRYRGRYHPTQAEWDAWNRHRQQMHAEAENGLSVKEALSYIRHPNWRWYGDQQ